MIEMVFFFNVDLVDIGVIRDDVSVDTRRSKPETFLLKRVPPPLFKTHTTGVRKDADGISYLRRAVYGVLKHAPSY